MNIEVEFPVTAVIAGVEVVTIPLSEYADLLAYRDGKRPALRQRLCRVERDPELATYVRSRITTATVDEVRVECLAKFGEARTPARSSIHRFVKKVGARA